MDAKPPKFRAVDEFIRTVWHERWSRPPSEMSRLHKFAHFWVLVGKSFARNRCPVRASALAYATLLALIPMLAVAVSITSTFLKKEGEERIDQFIDKMVASVTTPGDVAPDGPDSEFSPDTTGNTNSPPAIVSGDPTSNASGSTLYLPTFANKEEATKMRKEIARRINQFVHNTRSGTLGLTGTILLIFAAISMLSRIEATFNDIWGVGRGRTWFTRIVLYWGVISLAPMLLIVAAGLVSGPHLESARGLVEEFPFGAVAVTQVLPLVLLCLAFAVFYVLIPNTRVQWTAALTGGLIGGALWHLNSLMSVLFVSRLVSNSKIYGSLALVPVFMIGLYFSWLILLFGAQVAYAFQNRATYFEEKQVDQINQRGREFIALRLMTCVGQRFVRGQTPPNAIEIARDMAIPTRLTRQIMNLLSGAHLVAETSGNEAAFLPARPLESITCYDVLQAIRTGNGNSLTGRDGNLMQEVCGEFHRIEEAERAAAASVTLLALVNRSEAKQLPG